MKLKEAQALFTDHIDELLVELGVNLVTNGKSAQGCCPIHGGDNTEGFSISIRDGLLTWQCFTNACHENHNAPGVIQLIQALLQRDNPSVEFSDAIRWGLSKLGIEGVKSESMLKIDFEARNFVKWNTVIPFQLPKNLTTRQKTLEKLSIPGYYYIDRGFSEEILTQYDIGIPKKNEGHFKDRVLVPIYDMSGEFLVGVAGRTLLENVKPKWKYNPDFAASNYFFNIWKAKPYIDETKTAILVEGQMDCVRLAEAGIFNTLGVFGTDISVNQLRILNKMGVMTVKLAFDNDDAGKKATEKAFNKLIRYFRLEEVILPDGVNDPGEATLEQLQGCFI